MRDALIVWGGCSGHEREQCAAIIGDMLREEGFRVHVETSTKAFLSRALPSLSVIVPIYKVERFLAACLDSLATQAEGVQRDVFRVW